MNSKVAWVLLAICDVMLAVVTIMVLSIFVTFMSDVLAKEDDVATMQIMAEPIVYEQKIVIETKTSVECAEETEDSDTEKEDAMLARLCMGEAGAEPMIGKIAVIATVLNRAEMFDMTIAEVVSESGQYDGSSYRGIVTSDCYKAVELARYAVQMEAFPKTMIYFRADRYHSFGEPYTQIGNHYFSLEVENECTI